MVFDAGWAQSGAQSEERTRREFGTFQQLFHLSGLLCQIRRSMQHLHEVYSPESENLKSV
jgi:hypothetical protein